MHYVVSQTAPKESDMEAILVYGGPILVGFVLGYFFATPVIVLVTVVAAIVAVIYRPKREQELGAIFGVVVWIALGVGLIAMWGTHLYVTSDSLGFSHITKYIFRQ